VAGLRINWTGFNVMSFLGFGEGLGWIHLFGRMLPLFKGEMGSQRFKGFPRISILV